MQKLISRLYLLLLLAYSGQALAHTGQSTLMHSVTHAGINIAVVLMLLVLAFALYKQGPKLFKQHIKKQK